MLFFFFRVSLKFFQTLLAALVNKLGDPARRIAGSASNFLVLLLAHHPLMKLVVAEEIEHFVFRANVGQRAQYYAVCTLSQIILSAEDEKVAVKLIIVYLSLFKSYCTQVRYSLALFFFHLHFILFFLWPCSVWAF
jgi:hypothetical protein